MNHAVGEAKGHIKHPTSKEPPREKTISDQENRNLQHTDEQKPSSEQKSGNPPNQPAQQKQENPSGHPKSPQSEQEQPDQERKQQA
jgi:hypothetical protein